MALTKIPASMISGLISTLVNYTQAGVSAVVRTVQDKLRETASVKDFGAVGDGVVNDTAAFTAAQAAHAYVEVPTGMNCKVDAGLDYWKFYGRGTAFEPGRQWTMAPYPQTGAITKAYVARTFGVLETSVGSSITVNSGIAQTKENTQVLGTDTVGLAQVYTDRDHVGQFISSYSFVPDVLDSTTNYTGTTLTNTAVGPLNTAGKIKPGMIIDTLHAIPCTGRIQSISGNVITVDAWYARNGGASMIPATATGAILNPNNKIFGQNIVVSGTGNGTTTGAQKFSGVELDLSTPASTVPISGTWGFDMAVLGGYIDLGYQIRGKRNISYFSNNAGGAGLFGFYSIADGTSFRADDSVGNAWEGRSAGEIKSSISNIGVGKLAKLGVGVTVGSSIMDVYAVASLATATAQVTHESATRNAMSLINVGAAGDNKFCNFISDASYTERGSIDYNRAGGLTRFNTTSDATLKTLLRDAPASVSCKILSDTKLREYYWNEDTSKKPQIGPFAQELYQTFKGAVKVGGDVMTLNPDGDEELKYVPWGVDKTAFTFHLIAGWQEHTKQIAALEARLTAAGL